MKEYQFRKKGWVWFVSGLFLGLVLGLSIFFIDKYYFNEKLQVYKTFNHLYSREQGDTLQQKEDILPNTADLPKKPTKSTPKDTISVKIDPAIVDSTEIAFQGEDGLENVDFSVPIPDKEKSVVLDKILSIKKIKVKIKHVENEDPSAITPQNMNIEVQQWSHNIPNEAFYQFHNGVLKIKGMDITTLEVYFYKNQYYLFNNSHYFLLVQNSAKFDFLKPVEIP